MNYYYLLLLLFFTGIVKAQETLETHYGGEINLGMRTTASLFDNTNEGRPGLGTGGNFRIRLANRVNTDWFADYIVSTTQYVRRTDYHIGWSVMYYPFKMENKGFSPFILAGHCFDYTQMSELTNLSNRADRWSSAIQGGIGTHYYFTDRLEVTLQAQYMSHLGTHLHAHIDTEGIVSQVYFETDKGSEMEGHLLITLGCSYKLGKLWGRK